MQFLKTLFEYRKDEIGINNKNHTASTPHHSTTIDRSPSANFDANIVKKDMINEMIGYNIIFFINNSPLNKYSYKITLPNIPTLYPLLLLDVAFYREGG